MRKGTIERKTAETDVALLLDLDGTGVGKVDTGCGFLDHMLTLFARHGRFDLTVQAKGDREVDDHHTVEDVGICLGEAFREALADRRGIVRYGDVCLPMDEALVLSAVDLSGRAYLAFDCPFLTEKVGSFDTELVKEFFLAFVREAGITLHIRKLAGENSHHVAEAVFKGTARALAAACAPDMRFPDEIPSTKGVL